MNLDYVKDMDLSYWNKYVVSPNLLNVSKKFVNVFIHINSSNTEEFHFRISKTALKEKYQINILVF